MKSITTRQQAGEKQTGKADEKWGNSSESNATWSAEQL
jgi:hypothetical protein